jgi:hypothetical protein
LQRADRSEAVHHLRRLHGARLVDAIQLGHWSCRHEDHSLEWHVPPDHSGPSRRDAEPRRLRELLRAGVGRDRVHHLLLRVLGET